MAFSPFFRWMRKIADRIGFLCLIVYLAIGGVLTPNWRLRYKLTIEVQTPEGRLRGSSVIEVIVKRRVPFWGDSGIHFRIRGTAPAVELPGGRLVFALLHDAANQILPEIAVRDTNALPVRPRRDRLTTGAFWSRLRAAKPVIYVDAATMSRRKGNYPGAFYPDMVVLDPADLTSIRAIDPANSEAALGSGFSLAGIEIKIVEAPPDTVFDPPWLANITKGLEVKASSTGPLRLGLDLSRFVAR